MSTPVAPCMTGVKIFSVAGSWTYSGMVCDRMDVEAAAHLNDADARGKYREIASTAESGWDFSSRWGLRTTHIIPADLNCFLLMMERNMQRFAQVGHILPAHHSHACDK